MPLAVTLAVLCLATSACVGAASGSPPGSRATPRLTASPALPQLASPSEWRATLVAVGEQAELQVGASASIEGRETTVDVLVAMGPPVGCQDCPNEVRLLVSCPSERVELTYAFSGGMDEAALDHARRRAACALEFYLVEVHDGRATVRVDPVA
jgi:hypothetical protein